MQQQSNRVYDTILFFFYVSKPGVGGGGRSIFVSIHNGHNIADSYKCNTVVLLVWSNFFCPSKTLVKYIISTVARE